MALTASNAVGLMGGTIDLSLPQEILPCTMPSTYRTVITSY